ncbi:RNA methylase [Myriangium duriaei CBS 260.36]|uniref:Trimethylguanosine synthase n=1 Tax=Myriangium duriaei CBS 260.36 TaxID=1168546 RepID=A0A9P4MJP5_9PEZI|nr:RNA methylase [Myriangium duriaei CBS 260.36]
MAELESSKNARTESAISKQADLDQVHHYDSVEDMPENIQKYWHQRYDLFSLYDDGIRLTDDAWFGVTPEPVANKIADHLSTSVPASVTTIIDCFAGAGGNTIALALSGRWKQIFAIERDATTLACAEHNARLYGVHGRIWFIRGDCFDVLRGQLKSIVKNAVVFASPPWGGPGYRDAEVFDLSRMEPYGLEKLAGEYTRVAGRVVLYLPRSSDLNQIAGWRERLGLKERVRVTHYCMWGSSKAICVFLGDFSFNEDDR